MTVITIPNVTASVNPINTLCINSVAPILPTTSTNTIPYQGTWNPPIISTSTAGIFPYTFTPTPGQCGLPITINVTIQEVAAFSQIPQLCQDDPNPILPTISNNTPGITGVWTPATIDSSIPGFFTHTFLPNSGQCQTTVNMNITIVPAAPPSFIADNLTGCNPLPVNFSAINPIPGANYTWFLNNTEIGTGANLVYTINASGYHDITLEYELSSCSETTTYDDYIFMENDPIASFTFDPAVISSEIEAINFVNSSIGAVSYLWDFGDNSSSTVQNTSHTYTGASDNILVSLTASTPLGCFDIYEMTIVVLSEAIFYIPNTFTPDEDEHNQLWKPIFTSGFDIYSFNLQMYNRWGETIWETNDASAGWDGTYGIDGLKVPSGIYNWTIRYGSKINDDTKQVNGFVNVLY
jgi:gliding motility-associated-like protein